MAVQPLSHNCPIESKEPDANWGKMCTLRAAAGRFGILRFAVCVDVSVALFGRRTLMPCFVGMMLLTSILVCTRSIGFSKKWLVAAVSATQFDEVI